MCRLREEAVCCSLTLCKKDTELDWRTSGCCKGSNKGIKKSLLMLMNLNVCRGWSLWVLPVFWLLALFQSLQTSSLTCFRSTDPDIRTVDVLYDSDSDSGSLWSGTEAPYCSSISRPSRSSCVVCRQNFIYAVCFNRPGNKKMEGDGRQIEIIKSGKSYFPCSWRLIHCYRRIKSGSQWKQWMFFGKISWLVGDILWGTWEYKLSDLHLY